MAEVLHVPSEADVGSANLTRFMSSVGLDAYEEAWRWSTSDLQAFWGSIWDWFDVRGQRGEGVLAERRMPGAQWFPGAALNYAEQALRWDDDRPAVIFRSEPGSRARPPVTVTHRELRREVARVAQGLRGLGVARGDRVVAYAPNIPEALVMFLAAASIGAIWSSCSPDFGVRAVVDRFRQIAPKVLLAADGYVYKGSVHDRRDQVTELVRSLPSLEAVVAVSNLGLPMDGVPFDDLPPEAGGGGGNRGTGETLLDFERVPFDHPLWVLYSSGTTGLPKALVHGHGGIVLEHLKALSFHLDLGRNDRFFWFTSTGWMMWNLLVGGLLVGGCVVLYDGSPALGSASTPDLTPLWLLAEETGTTYFGTSAPYLQACAKAALEPRRFADLARLRGFGSTGAPLPPEGFHWVYDNVASAMVVGSMSGGTDVCTAFVGSCPLLPVRAGEIQCRCLGAAVHAFDARGRSVIDEVGELVVTEPMPSMPVSLWGDADGSRYRSSYFDTYPGVWRHGDWARLTPSGGCVIYGRSDSTLNRGGVRVGTSEVYRVVEAVEGVADSLVVDTGQLGNEGRCWLFVVPTPGVVVDGELRSEIAARIRVELSPRHVPDEIAGVAEVPRTLSGKKLEVPVKRILLGARPEDVASPGALANPESLEAYARIAAATADERR